MHNNWIILFFIESVYYTAINDIYLYKLPIAWSILYVLLTTILMYLWIHSTSDMAFLYVLYILL